ALRWYSFPTRRSSDLLEALDPVDRGERQGDRTEREAEGRGLAVHERPLDIAIRVLREGGLAKAGGEPNPNDEAQRGHRGEHRQRSEEHTSELQSRENL